MDSKKDDGLEVVMKQMGDFGRYQCFQFCLHILAAIVSSVQLLSLVVVAAVPEHRCFIDGVDNTTYTAPWNSSLVLDAIPINDNGKLEACKVWKGLDGLNKTLQSCDSWVYDTTYYSTTRGTEWNFVCSQRWMFAVAQSSTKFGAVIGSLVLGRLCDKYGRKTIFHLAGIMQLILGTVVAFTTEYYTFVFIRFLYGIFGISAFKAGFVLTIELIGPSRRTFCGSLFEVGYAVGVMLLGLWGFLVNNRFYLQILYALHATILLPHLFLMDESPRWLWSQGRVDEAIAIVKTALKVNKLPDSIDAPLLISSHKETYKPRKEDTHAGTLDLFKTPNMLRRTLIICFCWFANSIVYFGFTLNAGKLNGNPFFMLFLVGFVEVPGFILAMYFVHKIGHRTLVSIMMFMSGSCCLMVILLPESSMAVIVFVMLGKLIVSGTFSIVIKYSAEIFPTVARSSGVGLATMCSSLSGALTPLILLLDAFNAYIPTLVFGCVTVLSGCTVLLLPETFGRTLPQTLEDGERFGIGDTCFTSCKGRKHSDSSSSDTDSPCSVQLKSM